MTYYNKQKIKEIIKMYHHNTMLLKEHKKDYSSVGVAQGGIESTLPKAQGQTSDVVANEAIRQINANRYYSNIATDIKYVADRLYRITDERDAQIVNMFMLGNGIHDIANYFNCSRRNVDVRLDRIADTIISVTWQNMYKYGKLVIGDSLRQCT